MSKALGIFAFTFLLLGGMEVIRTRPADSGDGVPQLGLEFRWLFFWRDMSNPREVDHYYAVNGSLEGSWEGLDPGIGIVNWHGGLKGKNCRFFSELGCRQILAGYYDHDEDGSQITEWPANTKSVPRIVGAMYTTWEDKYDALDAWAKKAWSGKINDGS
jgi:hypothetical protein